jgi:transposase
MKKLNNNKIKALTIRELLKNGMKPKEVAQKLNTSLQLVYKWRKRDPLEPRKQRKGKLKRNHIKMLKKLGADKYTGINHASSRMIAYKLNRLFGRGRKTFNVSHSTVNTYLNRCLSKPRKVRKVFYLSEEQRKRRLEFAEYIVRNNIKGSDLFFTDESQMNFCIPLNKSTNRIRLTKKSLKELKLGKKEIFDKVCRPMKKYEQGFIVSRGLSAHRVGKLIFSIGKINTFSYSQALDYYHQHINTLNPGLIFQQD